MEVTTVSLLVNFLLYLFLPLWGIAGFVDWCCHRATNIEHTSGLRESFLHSLMGIQIAIPIAFCLLFQINVMILLICIATWFLHEWIAHEDVKLATPRREISIWEMHAHTYLGSLPLYMLVMILIINWPTFLKLITFDWQGQFSFNLVEQPHGGSGFIPLYTGFMFILCVIPYFEENLRCLIAHLKKSKGAV